MNSGLLSNVGYFVIPFTNIKIYLNNAILFSAQFILYLHADGPVDRFPSFFRF
jgi:hypothetical protein